MKTQLEEQDQQDTQEDGELGTFSVKAVTNEKTILEISQLLEKCYKLESAVKDSSTTKVLAKGLSKEVKDQSIKLSKSIAEKALIGLSGGTIGEVIAANW